AGFSAAAFWWLRPQLGTMLVPVAVYIIVITIMVGAAWCAFRNPLVMPLGAWALFVGAVAFYFSDLFVARDRFVSHQFLNRFIGLPLYYAGQFLLAFSVGLAG
ncbi:MAG: lysoplasmalogenase, partial [Deltaproteobacteria bacterium]|nr:lysoplasmalogenase [Deltaproteobacteria bacterium]